MPLPSSGSAAAELMGREHRLVVLLLVLDDHRVREEVVGAVEAVEDAVADVGDEPA